MCEMFLLPSNIIYVYIGKEYEDVYKQFLRTHQVRAPLQESSSSSRQFTVDRIPLGTQASMATQHQQKPNIQPVFTAPKKQLPIAPSKQKVTEPKLKIAISHPLPSSLFLPGDIQSPTSKSDLEEAIKLANSSLASSTQSKSNPHSSESTDANSMFEAFPNLLTNILPHNNGTSSNGRLNNYLGIDLYNDTQVTKDDLEFFPALFKRSDSFANDPYMNSESFTNFGEHGDIGDKNPPGSSGVPPVPISQAAPHRWMTPAAIPSGTHDALRQSLHDKPKQDIHQMSFQKQSPKKNPMQKESGVILNTQRRSVNAERPIEPIMSNVESSLPRMPNSGPLILEKVYEAEGFVKVKSKRQKRSTKIMESLSPSISARAVKPKLFNKFTDLDLDTESTSGSDNGSTHSFRDLSGHSGRNQSTDEQNGSSSQSKSAPYMSNGATNLHQDEFSSAFEPQLNGAAAATTIDLSSRKSSSIVCYICYERFANAEKLSNHCQSATHCSTVMKTIGGKKLIHFSPPHPKLQSKDFKLCHKYVSLCFYACCL